MQSRSRNFSAIELGLLLVASVCLAGSCGYNAWISSPTFDESAHFASGVIFGQTGDPGYFKVNPPANKWITAIATGWDHSLQLPPLAASASYSNSSRPEFPVGDALLEANQDHYLNSLSVARWARIPFLLLGGWMLWRVLDRFASSCRVLVVGFWCFSPLVLGHGWVVSADALAGVATCFILMTAVPIWRTGRWSAYALSGLSWGLAIGTKFTFAPLYLAFPIAIAVANRMNRENTGDSSVRPRWRVATDWVGRWLLHAAVACLVVNALYLFEHSGKPLRDHDFISKLFRPLVQTLPESSSGAGGALQLLATLPSPFPESFLEGIDQQKADMDFPRGAYLLGTRLEGKLPWFFAVAFWAKEQIAIPLAAILAIGFAAMGRNSNRESEEGSDGSAICTFCLLMIGAFVLLMTSQSNLVWIMRYLIPALPFLYVLLAVVLGNVACSRYLTVALFGIMVAEFCATTPFHFSYINPFFGGSYRKPPALNDSNFDYGQDLAYLKRWSMSSEGHASSSETGQSTRVYGILSGHGRHWLQEFYTIADDAAIDAALEAKLRRSSNVTGRDSSDSVLIVSLGLQHPEPWAVRYSDLGEAGLIFRERECLDELLKHPPDFYITPVLAGYYFDSH